MFSMSWNKIVWVQELTNKSEYHNIYILSFEFLQEGTTHSETIKAL